MQHLMSQRLAAYLPPCRQQHVGYFNLKRARPPIGKTGAEPARGTPVNTHMGLDMFRHRDMQRLCLGNDLLQQDIYVQHRLRRHWVYILLSGKRFLFQSVVPPCSVPEEYHEYDRMFPLQHSTFATLCLSRSR